MGNQVGDILRELNVRWTLLLFLLFFPVNVCAQQPTAVVDFLEGTALVSIQGGEEREAVVGDVLQAGDTIETQADSGVVLLLSDDSELQIGESTKLDIAILTEQVETGARESSMKVLWGRVRAFLSEGHQAEGSSFTFETPNALAGVKFSQPIVEVAYEPDTDSSTIVAHTVDVVVTNRRTGERREIPREQEGVVREKQIKVGEITEKDPNIFQKLPPPRLPNPPGGQKPPPPPPQAQGAPPPGQPPKSDGQSPPPGEQPKPEGKTPPPREEGELREQPKPEKDSKPERPERREKPERPERREKPERPERPKKSEQTVNSYDTIPGECSDTIST